MGNWLTLGEASDFLGVDGSTLRAWADAGQVRVFRTPGGHRRFGRRDLQALLTRRRTLRLPVVARRLDRQGRTLARARSGSDAAWSQALDDRTRRRVRRICSALMRALTAYVAAGPRRAQHRASGERAGRRLGNALAGRGLTPAQAAQAFFHFQGLMTDALTTRLALPPNQQVRSLRQVDAFLGAVMVRMMEAFERR